MAVLQAVQVGAVLDLENLLYRARRTSGAAVRAQFLHIVEQLRDLGEIRHAVACCDRWLAGMLAPVAGPAGVRIFPGPIGKDRADAELLRRAADVPSGANTLVVGSGDAAFAPLVAQQALDGRRTVVLGHRGAISAALRAAAHEVIELRSHTIDLRAAG